MRSFRAVLILLSVLFFGATHRASAQDAQSRLWDAAMSGDTAAIRKAVSEGAKVDSLDTRRSQSGRYALNWAAWFNHADAVQLLLELKAPIEGENMTGFTALNHAAENNSIDAAKILLAGGANPDHANKQGMTPLMVATMKGNETIAKLLEAAPRKK
jgi:ankyrin repeat protein